jgi:NAD+ kinase
MSEKCTPTRIAIAAHPKLPEAITEAAVIAKWLKQHGFDAPHGSLYDATLRGRIKQGEFDLLIAVGGDGTMLRAGHLCAPSGVPVLGINYGRLGFLFQTEEGGWETLLNLLLEGKGWREKRMTLSVTQSRAGEVLGRWDALNDAVVTRSQYIRPIQIAVEIDGMALTTYVADGLIASTATGSTAYALAAGGPILPPELRNILLIPIAPHLSVDRAVVLAEGSAVRMVVHDEYAVLSVDGQIPIGLAEDDFVDVCVGEHTVQFIRFGERDYFYRNLTMYMNQNPSTGIRR